MNPSIKTALFLLCGVIAAVFLGLVIKGQHKDRGFMIRDQDAGGCETRWSDGVPARVVLETASADLDPDLAWAIDFWNRAGFGQLFAFSGEAIDPSAASDPIILVYRGSPAEPSDPEMGDAHVFWGARTGNVCPIRRVVITMLPALSQDYQRRGLAHELGHALGLDHAGKENTVMYPSVRFGGTEITDLERTALKAITGQP